MRLLRLAPFFALALAASGCFGAIADLDSYSQGTGDGGVDLGSGPRDLRWKFNNFSPHAMVADPQIVVSNIVDSENYVAAIVIYDPFPSGRPDDMVMGRLAGTLDPMQTYTARTWADIDGNRRDSPDTVHGGAASDPLPHDDHSWVDPVLADGSLDIEHPDIDNNGDSRRPDSPDRGDVMFGATNFALRLHGVVVLSLTDTTADKPVGYYRFRLEMGVAPLGFHDIVVAGHTYTLSATLDMDGNDVASPGEPSSSMNATAGMPGENVTFTFDLNNFM